MKKIYLVHGWGGCGSGGWFDWLKKELKGKAEVVGFDMPNTDEPKISAWVGLLQERIKDVNEDTFFVGHSVGCQTILRFLERLPEGKKVGGCCFVAPWMELDKNTMKEEGEDVVEIARPWQETPINFDKVKTHCNNFLGIFSDNDPYVPLDNKDIFEKKLGAEIVIKKNHEHFNMVQEIPEVLGFLS